ncbi:MAG: RNA-guided endonuclease InsQ/TnpB family protein [Actinomadura sp.]
MLVGRRYRLALTLAQEQQCGEFGDICRAVWNTALEQRREYRRRDVWMNYVPQAAELAEAKKDFEWLCAAPSHILQQTLRDLDRACREHGTFKVRWRSKARWQPSFRFPDGPRIVVERIGRKWGRVKLPKLGWVRFRWSRPLSGVVRSATLSRVGRHWFISFLVENGTVTPEHHSGTVVGIDRGVVVAATTSTAEFHDREFATATETARYLRLQRKLARQRKGSKNRLKTIQSMGRISGRAVCRRTDFCAWTANRITARYSKVVLEDLRIRNMTTSAAGTLTEPGHGVAAKAGLNRAILDKGWHRLELALRTAARTTGTAVVLVNPAHTSQRCNHCGHVDPKSRHSQAVFECTACGHTDHADVNAAKNIKDAGQAFSACGDLAAGRSGKQESATSARRKHRPTSGIGIPRP